MPLGSGAQAFRVQSLALASLTVELVAGGERVAYVQPTDSLTLHANDSFVVFCASDANRVDLASLEIKPLPGYYSCTLAGDHLIAAASIEGGVHDIDLSSGRVAAFSLPGSFRLPVTAGDSLYGLASIRTEDGRPNFSLLRITR